MSQAILSESPKHPTVGQYFIFFLKTRLLIASRLWADLFTSSGAKKFQATEFFEDPNIKILGESITPLWTEESLAERGLQLGKVENLRRALRTLDGVIVPAGGTFSFWKQVGPPLKSRGFVQGRELRQGCLIPSTGGGLCQLSNALYDAALKAGFTILERHGHTQSIPGSAAEAGRDATVFWNYVDLRFQHQAPFLIEAKLTADQLIVRFLAEAANENP